MSSCWKTNRYPYVVKSRKMTFDEYKEFIKWVDTQHEDKNVDFIWGVESYLCDKTYNRSYSIVHGYNNQRHALMFKMTWG